MAVFITLPCKTIPDPSNFSRNTILVCVRHRCHHDLLQHNSSFSMKSQIELSVIIKRPKQHPIRPNIASSSSFQLLIQDLFLLSSNFSCLALAIFTKIFTRFTRSFFLVCSLKENLFVPCFSSFCPTSQSANQRISKSNDANTQKSGRKNG